MATLQQLNPFLIGGEVGYCIPCNKDIAHSTIKHWMPDPDSGDIHTLKLRPLQKDSNDESSYVGKYIYVKDQWESAVRDFFDAIEMEYYAPWKCLVAQKIPDISAPGDWKIKEFGLAHMDHGNLITRISWEKAHPDPTKENEKYLSAYSWPGC